MRILPFTTADMLLHGSLATLLDTATNLLISVDKHDTESRWLESSTARHGDVVALTDVVDVNWDAGIGADTMLLHE